MVTLLSGTSAAAAVAQTVDALSSTLQTSQDRATELAQRLLRVQVQQAVQDSTIGGRFDAYA